MKNLTISRVIRSSFAATLVLASMGITATDASGLQTLQSREDKDAAMIACGDQPPSISFACGENPPEEATDSVRCGGDPPAVASVSVECGGEPPRHSVVAAACGDDPPASIPCGSDPPALMV